MGMLQGQSLPKLRGPWSLRCPPPTVRARFKCRTPRKLSSTTPPTGTCLHLISLCSHLFYLPDRNLDAHMHFASRWRKISLLQCGYGGQNDNQTRKLKRCRFWFNIFSLSYFITIYWCVYLFPKDLKCYLFHILNWSMHLGLLLYFLQYAVGKFV